jgi:FtsP/CotA-like multicopper oxidase with cupredoxin domain
MKNLLWTSVLLLIGGLAFGQVNNVPPCTPVSGAGCTDYFGVANWASSPLPAGTITGFTVKASGSGYSAPSSLVVTLTDVNVLSPMTLTPTITLDASGGIATVTGTVAGTFIAPQITVTDMGPGWTATSTAATCGGPGQPACGSGAVVLATIGGTLSGGIRKFKDTITLPAANLQIATPDTTTFPGSDYYVIGLKEYTAQMHSDLPPTRLRGYCQMNIPGAPGACNPSYLGPTIIATKNRPVRVLFINMLPTGAGGNLFIPTDTTYMGAGMAPGGGMYTQNRATLHLHGGATPWISDGTPHQWTAPAGEMGPARGASVQFVPDMWFDASHNVILSCAGLGACTTTGATNDPGPGKLTFFWTNQQGGRLMFYHDHAYGITRLNVYAGEAAGYLLVDPVEETALAAATVPGTITATPDLAHLVPLVIQDKTFVPTGPEVSFEDPTWLNGFGTRPGFTNTGDLWFPHVYTTNQNPADQGGANAFGRWDYGPWTLPGNQTNLLAASPESQVQLACTSSAFPNQAVNCPITPNPSGTPEGFMDTPVVNGKAYPVLHVAPEAYRFQILAASNDRSWNLQWYLADPTVTTPDGRTNTEVKMMPSVQPSAGSPLPLCTQITPITNTTLFMGLATGLLDSSGNPINGTGLPAGCWPNFGAGSQTAGIPVQQTMWAADGRAGGVPDPTTAGPPFVEIGTEGGLLPAPVVIPSMPTGYEANTRSVTITNVSVHGLWIGPAERADAVVDFSKFAGKTLILYNDAPTPAPAVDSRLDYFTGDGDQSPIGGAPNTLPGYGPNTRTLMQVIVDQPATGAPAFQLSRLQAALPGIFAQTQPQIIVPEPTYPPASGGYSPVLTYSLISDATLTYFPPGSTTPVTKTDERKTIQELFTLDYGRMNATLGVELPLTNFLTQTTIPLGYIDPPTETIKQGDTQLWHITHNGVDTHFIHFHLFNVQVINRSGWDGTVRPPEQNELGWKDTVRMNPLEDILVALQPITPALPWPVPDSYHLLDVTSPVGSDCPAPANGPSPLPCSIFTDVNPSSNNPQNTPNKIQDFGWEYVWHCHILGHEENDMMRAIQFEVPPEAPTNLSVAPATPGLTLTWTDNSASETGFTLQRDTTAAFLAPAFIIVPASAPTDANGQGTGFGGTITYTDTAATGTGPYFYRARAFKPEASYWSPGPPITSTWSNVVSFGGTSSVAPMVLAFGNVVISAVPSPSLTATLSNASATTAFTYTAKITGTNAADFAVATDTCTGTAPAASTCPIAVTFTPTLTLPESANLVISTTAPGNPTYTVALTGTGSGLPSLIITANNTTMKYGSKALPTFTFSSNPPNPAGTLTPPTCTTTATAASPVGTYPITCTGAADASYALSYVTGTLTVTPVPLMIWGPNLTMLYGGTVPAVTPAFTGLVNGDTAATLGTAPNVAPVCNAYVTPPPPSPGTLVTSTTTVGKYTTVCSGAVDPNYLISYTNGTFTVSPAALTITPGPLTLPYNTTIPTTFALSGTGLVGADTLASLNLTQPPVACTTTATSVTPQPPTAGPYPITCTGPAQAPPTGTALYSVTYAPGLLTVSIATPAVTLTGAPATAAYQSSFTVTATTNALGAVAPTITGTAGVCTVGAVTGTSTATATVTMNAGIGSCLLTANWAAIPPNYTAATASQTTTATKIAPTVTFTGAPASAAFQSTFGVAATTNASTMPAIAGTPGICTVGAVTGTPLSAAATVTMISGTGTCALNASWAADANYNAATATQSTTAAKIAPTVTFTGAPASAVYNTAFPVNATANSSSPAVITASGGCTIAGTTVTMTSGTTACSLSASWAADANYLAAGPLTQTTAATKAGTTTLIGTNLPNPSLVGQLVTVTFNATGITVPTGTVTVNASTGQSCSSALSGGAGSCTLTFPATGRPTLTATYGGSANFNSSTSAAVTQVVSQVDLSTKSLVFGNQLVGSTSTSQNLTLTNVGTTALAFPANPISIMGPFSFTTTCPNGTSLNAGRNCTITVRFTPTTIGVAAGTLTVNTSDVASPAVITLSGTGVQAGATLSPVSHDFGTVTRGTTSAPFAFTLNSTGTTPLTISGITVGSGQYTITGSTCGTTLAVGSSCTINVAFSPRGKGTQTANLQVSDNAPGSPQIATLTGVSQ